LVIEDACLLGYRVDNSIRVPDGFLSFIEYLKRQAVFGSVEMSVHDQARMVVRDVADKWDVKVIF
jgi:hypothetical protein